MVRVGVDENLSPDLLVNFPREAEIVRIPRHPSSTYDVDLWMIAFGRRDLPEVFSHLRGVKVVQSLMAGVDGITPWLPQGVTLCDGRGIHDISTSEWTLAAILSSLKRFPIYRDLHQRQEWGGPTAVNDGFLNETDTNGAQYRILGDDLSGKSVLIVGYGSIGTAIEARLVPFGVTVTRVARTPKQQPQVFAVSELHQLIPTADIIILIVPHTPQTRGLIGAREIALMKKGALLVNAARGPILDTDALVEALNAHHIRAAVDVTEPEPLPTGHPLWSAPNLLITPHVAGSTPEFIHRAFRFGAEQLRRFLRNEPLENVVSDAGY